jgi:Family of unknown function (DUF6624)
MSVMDPGLREELLAMAAADQDARQRLDCHLRPSQGISEQELTAAEQIRAVDAANTARMQAIVCKRAAGPAVLWSATTAPRRPGCWSSTPTTTRPSSGSAWSCSAVLFRPGEADARHHAYLTDRVLLAEGSQQLYGTQFLAAGGSWQLRPLADPDRVDDRRRQVGLEPLANYHRRFEELHLEGDEDEAAT